LRVRVLTLRYDPLLDCFDERPLMELQASETVIGIRDHAFVLDGMPRLALVLECSSPPAAIQPTTTGRESRRQSEGEKWRELLQPGDEPTFESLRAWRRERARRDGVPPYVVATNRQLALLVRARPTSLAAMGEVEGFGKGKLSRFGEELLDQLRNAPKPAAPNPGDDTKKEQTSD
jgi:superfamily II DNA helicase RecQ